MHSRPLRPLSFLLLSGLLLFLCVPPDVSSQAWFGNGPAHKAIRAVTQSPDDPLVFYAGAFGWGVFKSSDGGQIWVNDRTGMTNTHVRALLALPGNVVFAGTNEGVFRSTDGGQTWSHSLVTASSVRSLAYDPGTASLFAATFGNGLYRSVNLGGFWAHLTVEDPLSGQSLAHLRSVSVGSTNLVYAGGSITDVATGGALFRSTNGGATWRQVQQGIGIRSTVMSIGISPSSPANILVIGTAVLGTYRSTNAGAVWNTLDGPATLHPIADQRINTIVISTTRYHTGTDSTGGVYYRTVGDTSNGWLAASGVPGFPAVVNALAIDRVTPATVYAGTEGDGVYRSTNSGTGWSPLNNGLLGVFARAVRVNGNGDILCGTQFGDGIWISTDQASSWTRAESLETVNSITALETTNSPALLYASAYGSGVFKSTSGGRRWFLTDSTAMNSFVRSLAVDPSDPATVFAGTGNGVYKTTSGGTTWFPANAGMPPGTSVRSLAIDPETPATVYAGTDSSYLFKSTNGGTSWTQRATGAGFLPQDVFIRCVTVDNAFPSIVLAGADSGRIYRSSDAGAGWTLLTSLPTVFSVRSIARSPHDRATLFSATFGSGVFVSRDSGETWTTLNAGLPDLEIATLEIDHGLPLTIYVGTGSHGVFRTPYLGPDQNTTLTIHEEGGWNLVSVPLLVQNGAKTSLFPTAISQAFAYQAGYQPRDTLVTGEGYWLKFPSPVEVQITGAVVSAETIAVAAGWNLIGSITTILSPADVSPVPPLAILSPLYGFAAGSGYAAADVLEPGHAYWVKVSQSGQVILRAGSRRH